MSEATRYYGKHRAVVLDSTDPLAIGRVRAEVPGILGGVATGWALPCLPYAPEGVAVHQIPPPGTSVWIEFEGGDPSNPIWSGCFWTTPGD